MILRGQDLWKFNKSVTSNRKYAEKMKNYIFKTLHVLDLDNATNKQFTWEFLK